VFAVVALLTLLADACSSSEASLYDPLALPEGAEVTTLDLSASDPARGRDIPVLVYLPPGSAPAPVVLFSHGLGGSREGSTFLGQHWSARGYVAVFLQHAGSDALVWRDLPPQEVLPALNRAATAQNLLLRLQDVAAVLDQLDAWNRLAGHPLQGRLDLARVGMSGHSFGAQTTQGVSGQRYPAVPSLGPEPRIKAAVIMSPSPPAQGDPATAFGSVAIPWLLMTGTLDETVIGANAGSRLNVYPHLPPTIDRYEIVLHEAQHYIFTDRSLLPNELPRNPNHQRVILALSTAFWDAYLRQDSGALDWLQGKGARSILGPQDRWQVGVAGK
jgi:dienelactone hydrolase